MFTQLLQPTACYMQGYMNASKRKIIYAPDLEHIGILWVNQRDDEDAVIVRRHLRKACTNTGVDLKIGLMLDGGAS